MHENSVLFIERCEKDNKKKKNKTHHTHKPRILIYILEDWYSEHINDLYKSVSNWQNLNKNGKGIVMSYDGKKLY